MADEYEKVARGKLKLKTDGEISKKKKKKRDKEREREKAANVDASVIQIVEPTSGRPLTKAEESFKKMQDKMVSHKVTSSKFKQLMSPPFSKKNGFSRRHRRLTSSKWKNSTKSSTISQNTSTSPKSAGQNNLFIIKNIS